MATEFNTVRGGHGLRWITQGVQYYKRGAMMWLVMIIVYVLLTTVFSFVPLLGQIAPFLLAPVFVAGFAKGTQALAQDDDMEIQHLFYGFKQPHIKPLLGVGLFYFFSMLLAMVVMSTGIDSEIVNRIMAGKELTEAHLEALRNSNFVYFALIAMLIMLVSAMALWFAPLLVLFRGYQPAHALKTSFFAILNNTPAFFVYGFISLLMLMVLFIPQRLGWGLFSAILMLVFMIPVMIAALYASYQDIFAE